jgi:type I restriction enzyme S subunit
MATEYVEEGVPFLRSLNVREHRIDLTDVRYISAKFNARLRKSLLHPGDVVTVRTGKPGTTAVVPPTLTMANCSDVVITRPGPDLDARWLSYYINGIASPFVASRLVGAVQQHFNVGAAKEMELLLPPIEEQRAIAATLGALDDKIESNRQAIVLAEGLGDALFAGSREGDAEISAVADLTMGSSPPGTSYNEEGVGVPFYQGVRDFGQRYPGRRVWTTHPIRLAQPGDTLVSVRAPVGQLNRASEVCCIGRGVASVRSDTPSTVFYSLRSASALWTPFQQEGTVFGAINRSELSRARIPWPSRTDRARLEARLSLIDEAIASLTHETSRLRDLRDTLLPGLLSGAIRVAAGARL